MAQAARLGDSTSEAGAVVGPGASHVLINGLPAAVAGDGHVCGHPAPHPPTVFLKGSSTVLICGRGALRVGDSAACGASIVSGASNVIIGG
jgi:uncharacterized Zn-binding protein involved in type VI secretion